MALSASPSTSATAPAARLGWRPPSRLTRRSQHMPRALPSSVTETLQAMRPPSFELPSSPELGDAQAAVEAVRGALRSGVQSALAAPEPLTLHWGASLAKQWLEAAEQWVTQELSAPHDGGVAAPPPEVAAALEQLQAQLRLVGSQLGAATRAAGLSDAMPAVRRAAQQVSEQLSRPSQFEGLTGLSLPDVASGLAAGWASLSASTVGGYDAKTLAIVAAGVCAAIAASVPPDDDSKHGPGPGGGRRGTAGALPSSYDPEAVDRYYAQQPVKVAARTAQVAAEAALFGAALLRDMMQDRLEANSPDRARQLRRIIERLGPAAIKVAQALSTRVDILNPFYLAEIERLQDRVPPFSDADAMAMIAEAYGQPISSVFAELAPSPVAAASLGQVYKGTLREGGMPVAVKVQRPGVLESVALDLCLMRRLALALRRSPKIRTDWAALIDEWAARFFDELDYEREAANASRFKQDVIDEGLTGIVVPDIYKATRQVLVMQWIEGEKLAESTAADVRELCNTLLSAYLSQLLDTGFLHSDPHPGNLLRTPDGKIAVLDYGLMTTIPEEYSLSLVEYIAHLTMREYDLVADDLVKLGFVPSTVPSPRDSGLAEPIGRILSQLVSGGGAAKVNVDLVLAELRQLQTVYPYFQIPAYFALILRCFSVIEGIALRSDPDYAIVQECVPYISKRLLTDDHPRARAALRQLLFGDQQHIDAARLQLLVDGLQSYTVAGLQPQGGGGTAQQPLIGPTARDALRAVFSSRGSYAQELLVEQAVAATDAAARQLASELAARLLGGSPLLAGLQAQLGTAGSLPRPVASPLQTLNTLAASLQPDEEDRQAIALATAVQDAVLQLAPAQLTPKQGAQYAVQLAGELAGLLPELLPGVARTGELYTQQLAARAAQRLAQGLQGSPSEMQSSEL